MIPKLFVAFVLIGTFQLGSANPNYGVGYRIFEPAYYLNNNYLNQTGVLLPDSSTEEVCFLTTFLTQRHFLDLGFRGKSKEVFRMWVVRNMQKWQSDKFEAKIKNNFDFTDSDWEQATSISKCSFSVTDFIQQYELPKNWENGVQLDLLDGFIIWSRKLFELNEPESCNNGKKFIEFVYHMIKKLTRSKESIYELRDDGKSFVTTKICIPLKKYSEVPDFVYSD